jgi:5-(carboxyamino)imidazole ribonucleotide synthase
MLALAGIPLGMSFVFLDPAHDACAGALGRHLCGEYDDEARLTELLELTDVITYEFENVPDTAIASLADRGRVFPGANALAVSRDRLKEKTLFRELGIGTPDFEAVDSLEDLTRAAARIGYPSVLKTRSMGYDGKGQTVLRGPEDLDDAWSLLGAVPLILEAFVPFDREVSIVAVRDQAGASRFYPLAENVHVDGILRTALSKPGDPSQPRAQEHVGRLLDALDYVGVLTLELFDVGGELLANEFAPRVHNSGHWTIEGAETGQFENHLRAVCGLPLGSTDPVGFAAMVNFIGTVPAAEEVLTIPQTHLHDYAKEPRAGRKVGHATVRAEDERALADLLAQLVSVISDKSSQA